MSEVLHATANLTPPIEWPHYDPLEKPRVILDPEPQVALAAFFNLLEERRGGVLRRVYLPSVPLTTFAKPDDIYREVSTEESYLRAQHASEDFHQMRGGEAIRLYDPTLGSVQYDGNTILAILFRNKALIRGFKVHRLGCTDDAEFSLRNQAEEGESDIRIDKSHQPDIVMPLARTYTNQQINSIISEMEEAFRSFPDELLLRPRLAVPDGSVTDYPATLQPDDSNLRSARIEAKVFDARYDPPELRYGSKKIEPEHESAEEYRSLYERGLRHARAYPNRQVVWLGTRQQTEAASLSNFVSISNAPEELLVIK